MLARGCTRPLPSKPESRGRERPSTPGQPPFLPDRVTHARCLRDRFFRRRRGNLSSLKFVRAALPILDFSREVRATKGIDHKCRAVFLLVLDPHLSFRPPSAAAASAVRVARRSPCGQRFNRLTDAQGRRATKELKPRDGVDHKAGRGRVRPAGFSDKVWPMRLLAGQVAQEEPPPLPQWCVRPQRKK